MKKSSLPFSLLLIIFLCFSPALLLGSMAEEPQKQVNVVEEPQKQADVAGESQKQAGAVEEGAAAVHIVYVEQPPEGEVPEDYHVRTLASVLGRFDLCVLIDRLIDWLVGWVLGIEVLGLGV